MSRTAHFCRVLRDSLNNRKTHYAHKWKSGTPPHSCSTRECVDLIAAANGTTVLIEVELRRAAPVANIAKIWRWLEEMNEYQGKVIVIQAFSSYYDKKEGAWQRTNSEFLGKHMAKHLPRVRYIPVPFPYSPYKKWAKRKTVEGGLALERAARKLASQIVKEIKAAESKRAFVATA